MGDVMTEMNYHLHRLIARCLSTIFLHFGHHVPHHITPSHVPHHPRPPSSIIPHHNALDTGDRVKAKMEELSKYFPAGMKAVYPYDTTPFVKISLEEVVHTLIVAVFLVFIIMFLFLQNIRATLIPTIAVNLTGT